MAAIFVVNKDGNQLMPTFNRKKVRHMLKDGRARIFRYRPFTIQLTYKTTNGTQDIEYCTDTGYVHVGISMKSEKHECMHMQADMLEDEKQHHDDRRKNKRTRRNHLRYRKPRFNNRRKTKQKGWIAPTLQHKMENQVRLYEKMREICPISSATLEVGEFDTQALEAIEAGQPIPEREGYQQGPRYSFGTLRKAVFYRDGYTCQCCESDPFKKPGTILVIHHALYWNGDHTDRMASLMTLCTKCHTAANHQEGGKLWGLEPKSTNKAGAAFMNTVRWRMLDAFKTYGAPVHLCYGASTKRERLDRNIEKTHANDAYCIGRFRPKHRTQEVHIVKKRRNDRCLEKFRDAVYIDSHDGSEKHGKELSSGRTKRKEPRHGENDLRKFRKEKVLKGCRAIRKQRYEIRPGDTVLYNGKRYTVHGTQNSGKTLALNIIKTVKFADLQPSVTKKGEAIPIAVGQKLALIGRKERHEVLHIDQAAGMAVMRWYMGVKPDEVIPLTCSYGGYKIVS